MQYEIRAMSLAEILDMGFRLLRNHFGLLLGISAVVYLPYAVLAGLFEATFDSQALGGDLSLSLISIWLLLALVAFTLVSPLVTCAITHALGELYLGRPTSIGGAFRAALPRLLPLAGTWLLAAFAILAGLLLLVVPGLYLMLAFTLVTQIIMLEGLAGVPALGRSRHLMQGNLLRAFALGLVVALLGGVLSFGLELVFAVVPNFGVVGSALAQAVAFAYYSAVGVVFYFDVRARKEAFDLEHLARLVELG
jgi:hypothetical protein